MRPLTPLRHTQVPVPATIPNTKKCLHFFVESRQNSTKGQIIRQIFGGFRKSIIYKEEELEEGITCAKFAHMGKEGDQPYEYTAL